MLDGNPRYSLAVGMFPERLSAILRRQKMPSDRVAVIVDNSETIVARTVGGDEFVGKKVSPDLMRELRSAAEGSFEGVTLEGVSVLTGFSRSTVSGWSVAIGVPKAGPVRVPQAGAFRKRRCGHFAARGRHFSRQAYQRADCRLDPRLARPGHRIGHTGPADRAAGRHPGGR